MTSSSAPPVDSLLFSAANLSFASAEVEVPPKTDLFAGFGWHPQQQQHHQQQHSQHLQHQHHPQSQHTFDDHHKGLPLSSSTASLEEYRFGGTPSHSQEFEDAQLEVGPGAGDISMLSGFSSSSISSLGSDLTANSSSFTSSGSYSDGSALQFLTSTLHTSNHASVSPGHSHHHHNNNNNNNNSPSDSIPIQSKPTHSPSRPKPTLQLPFPPARPIPTRRGSDQLIIPSGPGLNTLANVRKLSNGGGSQHLNPSTNTWASLGTHGLPASPLRIEHKELGPEPEGEDVNMEDHTMLGATGFGEQLRRGSAGAQGRPALGSRTSSASPTAKMTLGGVMTRKGSQGSPYERILQLGGAGTVAGSPRKLSLPQPLSPESPTIALATLPPTRPKLEHHAQHNSYYQHQQQQQLHQQQTPQPSSYQQPQKSPLSSSFSLPNKPAPSTASYFPTSQQTPPQTPKYNVPSLSTSPPAPPVAAPAASDGPSTLSPALLDDHTLNPLFASRYLISSSLGSGGFGFVCVALDLRNPTHPSFAGHPQPTSQTHREVAVKFILADKVPRHAWVEYGGGGEAGDGMPERGGKVPMECEILRRVRHWGVVRGEGLYFDQKFFYLVRYRYPLVYLSEEALFPDWILFGNLFYLLQVQELHGSSWAPSSTPGTPTTPSNVSLPMLAPPPSPYAPSYALPASPFGTPNGYPFAPLPPASPIMRPSSANMERRGSCDLFECVEMHKRFSENKAKMIFKQVGQ